MSIGDFPESLSHAMLVGTMLVGGLGVPVPVKKTPLRRRRTLGKVSLKNTKSGAGEEFLLLFCRAEARAKGVFFCSQTPVLRSLSLDSENAALRNYTVH